MHAHRFSQLTDKDWEELAKVPEVRDVWELPPESAGETLAFNSMAVKFDFVDTYGSYIGDLIIIHQDRFAPPMVLFRDKREKLVPIHYPCWCEVKHVRPGRKPEPHGEIALDS